MPAPLPPLPPAFRITDADVRPGGRNMIDILSGDHLQLALLCDRLAPDGSARSLPPALRRPPVVDVLIATLTRHLCAEEQYLYPTVRAVLADGDHVADHELVEHAAMVHTLRRLQTVAAGDPEFPRLVDAITAHVRRHASRASREILPRLRAACTDNELIRLGNRVEIAQEAAPTRPHPATPVSPPANKLVDPAMGVIDKVRDALTGRRTRVGQLHI